MDRWIDGSAAPCFSKGAWRVKLVWLLQVPIRSEGSLAPHTPRRHLTIPGAQKDIFMLAPKTHPRASKSLPEAIQNRITFSSSFFDGFGSNLAPTWSQLAPNLEPKSFQNPSQEPSKTHPKSHHILNDFLDGFWMHF